MFFEGYSCDVLDISYELRGMFDLMMIDGPIEMDLDSINTTIEMESMESASTLTEDRTTRDDALVALFSNVMLVSSRFARPGDNNQTN